MFYKHTGKSREKHRSHAQMHAHGPQVIWLLIVRGFSPQCLIATIHCKVEKEPPQRLLCEDSYQSRGEVFLIHCTRRLLQPATQPLYSSLVNFTHTEKGKITSCHFSLGVFKSLRKLIRSQFEGSCQSEAKKSQSRDKVSDTSRIHLYWNTWRLMCFLKSLSW